MQTRDVSFSADTLPGGRGGESLRGQAVAFSF